MAWATLATVFGLAFGIIALVMLGLAAGLVLGRRELRGSCGGLSSQSGTDGQSACSLCSGASNCRDSVKAQVARKQCSDDNRESEHCEKDCVAEGCTPEEIAACRTQP